METSTLFGVPLHMLCIQTNKYKKRTAKKTRNFLGKWTFYCINCVILYRIYIWFL